MIEQRNALEKDWVVEGMSDGEIARENLNPTSKSSKTVGENSRDVDASIRKRAYNAPKRLAKLEQMVASLEQQIATVDKEMIANGSDVGKLIELTKQKEKLESQVSIYMNEWVELEELLSLVEVK
jgi:ABC transport system ATP-binding/permease protein